jgi:2-keto-4-pentenoate hydratase/2-oxohepta-3-ene-1,7-dioic acid hydratase in catechol pathway
VEPSRISKTAFHSPEAPRPKMRLSLKDQPSEFVTLSGVIWCLALNFKTHLRETGQTTSTEFPHVFLRTTTSLVEHGEPLLCPSPDIVTQYDYEGELGVVIGRDGRNIAVGDALNYIAGYTCVNEGSVREFQRHNRNFGLGKNFEGSGSIGPWLVPAATFGHPSRERIITRVNGIERQNEALSDMLFGVEAVIHYLSLGYRLQPGDVIAMGTPGALASGLVHMIPGDEVEIEVSNLGILRNPVILDPEARSSHQ